MRVKGVISYKGTSFYGFQIQKDNALRSVQGEIEKALKQIFSREIKIHASGRTDRGVHALGQVIHFDIDEGMTMYRLKYSLNCLLPSDIHVNSLEIVDENFHARYSAKSKTYQYLISVREYSPLNSDLVFYSSKMLDLEKMKEAMNIFIGVHDFHNFCTNDEDFVREIYSFDVTDDAGNYTFLIKGNGFRRYMVRMIMGCVIQVGLGKIEVEALKKILEDKSMNRVKFKANAEGLYLLKVEY